MPGWCYEILSDHLCVFQKLLFFKNICCYHLIFLVCAFKIHVRYLLYSLDFTNGRVSNNPNLLEVFFCVNLLPYLKYTGSFLVSEKIRNKKRTYLSLIGRVRPYTSFPRRNFLMFVSYHNHFLFYMRIFNEIYIIFLCILTTKENGVKI